MRYPVFLREKTLRVEFPKGFSTAFFLSIFTQSCPYKGTFIGYNTEVVRESAR